MPLYFPLLFYPVPILRCQSDIFKEINNYSYSVKSKSVITLFRNCEVNTVFKVSFIYDSVNIIKFN